MKIRSTRLMQLWQKVKDTWNVKASQYAEVPPGACALVFPDQETYRKMINALADAQTWTGTNYPKQVLSESTLINN